MNKYGVLAGFFVLVVGMFFLSPVMAQDDNFTLPDTDTETDTGFLAALMAFGIICALLPLIINILIAVYMYKDATKRGESGVLWAIIGFFLSIIGLIIWLIVRKNKPVQPQA